MSSESGYQDVNAGQSVFDLTSPGSPSGHPIDNAPTMAQPSRHNTVYPVASFVVPSDSSSVDTVGVAPTTNILADNVYAYTTPPQTVHCDIDADDAAVISPSPHIDLNIIYFQLLQQNSSKKSAPPAKKKTPGQTKRQYNKKPKDPRRDTSVSFEEMNRIMRVYGPTKQNRAKTPRKSDRVTKLDSIRRKFQRWFPDFEERFEKTPDGWYRPRIGHAAEIKYREEMRNKDKNNLARKRGEAQMMTESAQQA